MERKSDGEALIVDVKHYWAIFLISKQWKQVDGHYLAFARKEKFDLMSWYIVPEPWGQNEDGNYSLLLTEKCKLSPPKIQNGEEKLCFPPPLFIVFISSLFRTNSFDNIWKQKNDHNIKFNSRQSII